MFTSINIEADHISEEAHYEGGWDTDSGIYLSLLKRHSLSLTVLYLGGVSECTFSEIILKTELHLKKLL